MSTAITRERPLTAEERARIEAELKELGGGGSLMLTGALVFVILFLAGVALVALFDLPRPAGRGAAGLVAGLAAARVYLGMRRSLTRSPAAELIRSDLAGGTASESTFDVTDAIEVEELEDEGANYYLELADGRVVFLSGQYLEDSVAARKFPSARIVIVRGARSRMLLSFECTGASIAPSATLPPFTQGQYESGEAPSDGDVLEIDFELLRARSPR